MKMLYDLGLVKRFLRHQIGFDEWVYTPSLLHKQQAEHYLAVTETYIELRKLPGTLVFEPLYHVFYTVAGARKQLIADALVLYTRGPLFRLFFLEIERRPIKKSRYPKLKQYDDLLESGAWRREEWSNKGKYFPVIVVVAEEDRLRQVRRAISLRKPKANWLLTAGDDWKRVLNL